MAEIDVDALITLYNSTVASLADLVSDSAVHHSSYEIDGQKVSKTEYQKMLQDRLKSLREEIDRARDPYELETEVWT